MVKYGMLPIIRTSQEPYFAEIHAEQGSPWGHVKRRSSLSAI